MAILVGVVVTLLAGLFPAIRATRVPPIAAVREGAELPRGRFARFSPFVAGVFLLLSLFLLGQALFKDDLDTAPRLLSIVGGVLLLFIGVAMLSRWTIRPLAAVVGWPATRIGGAAGKLARGNSTRNTQRTASTAAALMIGVALVTFVAVLANGFKASNRDAIESQVQRRLRHHGAGRLHAVRRRRRRRARRLRRGPGGLGGALRPRQGLELGSVRHRDRPRGDQPVLQLRLGRGLRRLGARKPRLDDGAIVSKDFAEDNDLEVGSPVTVLSADNKTAFLDVRASTSRRPFFPILGAVSINKETFDSLYERPRDQFVFANTDGDTSAATTEADHQAVADFPDAKVQIARAWITQQDEDFNSFLIVHLRAPRPRRRRLALRHGQHARPDRVRADAGDRDAPRGRHDPPPDAAHDPARERHHRADRRRARAPARHLPGRPRHEGARASST